MPHLVEHIENGMLLYDDGPDDIDEDAERDADSLAEDIAWERYQEERAQQKQDTYVHEQEDKQ